MFNCKNFQKFAVFWKDFGLLPHHEIVENLEK